MHRIAALALSLTLLIGPAALAAGTLVPLPVQPAGVPWPTRAWPAGEPEAGVDRAALAVAIDDLFGPLGRGGLPDTRAVAVVHRGRLVASRYAEGFGPGSRFESWSMAKTVTQALIGILVRQGRVSVDQPTGIAGWQREGDPRRAITVRHLLHMTTGLDNADGEGERSFGGRLLFGDLSRDVVASSSDVPLRHEPGTYWEYSTGTSMLLADVAARAVGGKAGLLELIQRELAAPLGITTLVPEFDAAGNFLGGSSVWASAEDWARIGLLYLRGGRFDGSQVFADGWVDFCRAPAPAANNRKYGAQMWLNFAPAPGQFDSIPGAGLESMFLLSGARGQYVAMVPERDLVIVRLGEMDAMQWPDLTRGIGGIAAAFAPRGADTP